jgi:hypothetical protein
MSCFTTVALGTTLVKRHPTIYFTYFNVIVMYDKNIEKCKCFWNNMLTRCVTDTINITLKNSVNVMTFYGGVHKTCSSSNGVPTDTESLLLCVGFS